MDNRRFHKILWVFNICVSFSLLSPYSRNNRALLPLNETQVTLFIFPVCT